MALIWRVSRDGKEVGVFAHKQIVSMAQDGTLKPTDLLSKDGAATSVQAGSIRGLFSPAKEIQVESTTVRATPELVSAVGTTPAPQLSVPRPDLSNDDKSVDVERTSLLGKLPVLSDVSPVVKTSLAVFVAACLLFVVWVVWFVKRSEQIAADRQSAVACAAVEKWLADPTHQTEATAAIRSLTIAVERGRLSAAAEQRARTVLDTAARKQAEIAEERSQREAQRAAQQLFNAAEKAIAAKNPHDAVTLLTEYIGSVHASRVSEATSLLEEVKQASSEDEIVASLVRLSDDDFAQAQATGRIPDGKVTRPELAALRIAAVRKLVARAESERKKRLNAMAAEKAERIATIAERAATNSVQALERILQVLRPQAPAGALNSPLFAFREDAQSRLKQELTQRLIAAAGDSDVAEGVEQKMVAEGQRWLQEVQSRLEAEVREASRSRASRIIPSPVPPGPFRQRVETLSKQTDVDSLRTWGRLKVLIASRGLSLEDMDWGEWHLANKTPMQDFSPDELEKYKRYLQLAAAGY